MSKTFVCHPQKDENGNPVVIESPSVSTPPGAWLKHDAVATLSLTDGGVLPAAVNNIPFSNVPCPENTDAWLEWNLRIKVNEPPYPQDPDRRTTSGCVVIEPDDRIWIVHPSNRFAQAITTFPKGRLSLSTPSRKHSKNPGCGCNPRITYATSSVRSPSRITNSGVKPRRLGWGYKPRSSYCQGKS